MATVGNSLLIVPYEWKVENVEKDFKTISSNLILFGGEKVFRVALKKTENGQSTLFFLAINLNKIGLQVSEVFWGKKDVESHCKMNENQPPVKKDNHSKGGNFQFFTMQVDGVTGENFTFVFEIHLKGIVDGYSYHPCDRLAKEQLWSAVNNKLHADVEFIVQDKRFSAHKAILAARSPVFKVEFTKEKSKKDNSHQIRIHDVDASTFEQFLHFVYTDETPLLANANLLKLAERYQLKTLENLCRVALLEVDVEQMISVLANPKSSDGQETSCKIRSEFFLIFNYFFFKLDYMLIFL